MTIIINDPATMNRYIAGIMAKANHHGRDVTCAIPMLEMLVARYGIDVEVADRKNGRLGSVSWFTSKATGRRYYFRYDYPTRSIELLLASTWHKLANFTNRSTASDYISTFENL